MLGFHLSPTKVQRPDAQHSICSSRDAKPVGDSDGGDGPRVQVVDVFKLSRLLASPHTHTDT